MEWKDENTIDTLAAAYAETGDFKSAVQYASQALSIKKSRRQIRKESSGICNYFNSANQFVRNCSRWRCSARSPDYCELNRVYGCE
jgi:hypothetical protein